MSANVMEGSKQEERQSEAVWRALKKVRLPGPDKDFIRQALWKKLAVGSRMHSIFPKISPLCPFDNEAEDHYHRFKTCLFLQKVVQILRTSLPPLHVGGVSFELGRICVDEPLLSLKTPHGLVMWRAIRSLWAYRCDVIFRKVSACELAFLRMVMEGLRGWLWSQEVRVPNTIIYMALRGIMVVVSPRVDHDMQRMRVAVSAPRVQGKKRLVDGCILLVEGGGRQGGVVQNRVVYTDGSFAWETAGVGFAGWGVYVEGEVAYNMSEPLEGEKQTNNRAELMAVIWVFENLPQEWSLSVVTDSQYVLLGLQCWLPKWKISGWRVAGARPVENRDLWERFGKAVAVRISAWTIFWTRGHMGLEGNELADRLANDGRQKHPGRRQFLARSALQRAIFFPIRGCWTARRCMCGLTSTAESCAISHMSDRRMSGWRIGSGTGSRSRTSERGRRHLEAGWRRSRCRCATACCGGRRLRSRNGEGVPGGRRRAGLRRDPVDGVLCAVGGVLCAVGGVLCAVGGVLCAVVQEASSARLCAVVQEASSARLCAGVKIGVHLCGVVQDIATLCEDRDNEFLIRWNAGRWRSGVRRVG